MVKMQEMLLEFWRPWRRRLSMNYEFKVLLFSTSEFVDFISLSPFNTPRAAKILILLHFFCLALSSLEVRKRRYSDSPLSHSFPNNKSFKVNHSLQNTHEAQPLF
jgi:hypothetical protein